VLMHQLENQNQSASDCCLQPTPRRISDMPQQNAGCRVQPHQGCDTLPSCVAMLLSRHVTT
jgi:hypothetical protein